MFLNNGVFFLYEPYNIAPDDYDINSLKKHKVVVTVNPKFYEETKDILNIKLYRGYIAYDRANIPFVREKNGGICLMCKNREPKFDFDLINERFGTLVSFSKQGYICHHYGVSTRVPDLYKGTIEPCVPSALNQLKVLSQYKYCVCFENCYHKKWSFGYLTEKLFNCFRAGVIPIYLGCFNIEEYIPRDFYIDWRHENKLRETDITGAYDFDQKSDWLSVDRFNNFIKDIV